MRVDCAGHCDGMGELTRKAWGIRQTPFWSIALALSMSTVLCSCEDLANTHEVLKTVQGNGFVIVVEKVCAATAIGHCEVAAFKQSQRPGWFGRREKLLIESRDCDGFDVQFLEDSLLLAGCTDAGTSAIDPLMVIPIGLPESPLRLDNPFNPGDLNSTNVAQGVLFAIETFSFKDDPRKHVIHLTYNKLTSVTRNIYITHAESVSTAFRSDDMLEITVHWVGGREPTVMVALLPREGRLNMEVFVKDAKVWR